jgi:hypothetical protein
MSVEEWIAILSIPTIGKKKRAICLYGFSVVTAYCLLLTAYCSTRKHESLALL